MAPQPMNSPGSPAREQVAKRIYRLLELAPNWDSYGASSVDRAAAARAVRLILEDLPPEMPTPLVNATSSGGVQLEWHRRGANAEIEVAPGGQDAVVYLDDDGVERECEGSIDSVWPLLKEVGEVFRRPSNGDST